MDATYTADALDDDGCDIALGNAGTNALNVAQLEELDGEGGVDRCLNLRVLGDVDSSRRSSVEGVAESDDLLLARVERGKFQGILVGLGTRIDEEELVVVVTTDRT